MISNGDAPLETGRTAGVFLDAVAVAVIVRLVGLPAVEGGLEGTLLALLDVMAGMIVIFPE